MGKRDSWIEKLSIFAMPWWSAPFEVIKIERQACPFTFTSKDWVNGLRAYCEPGVSYRIVIYGSSQKLMRLKAL